MLALVAGRGGLPAAVARAQSPPLFVTSLAGHTPDNLRVDMTFRIEKLGSLLDALTRRGVHEVCFCGAIARPTIDSALVDARTAPMLPVLAKAAAGGEDSALRAVVSIFEEAGFGVRGAHDLAPSLLPIAGVLTQTPVPAQMSDSIALAQAAMIQQAVEDVGQACVVRQGTVIAREDARGTDAMLADLGDEYARPHVGGGDPLSFAMDVMGDALGSVADWLSGPAAQARATGKGGVMFKAPKPGQDRRVDLPTIGPRTAMRAAEAGLDGIVLVAGGVMVLDQDQTCAILDKMGMFLWVR